MRTPDSRRGAGGFTLVEMVMVIVITGLVASLGGLLLHHGVRAYFLSREQAEIDWQGRLALERMLRDLRRLRSTTPADLVMNPSNRVTFVDVDNQTISYVLSGGTLLRNGKPLADGVSALDFLYLKSDGRSVAGNASQVFYISASFTLTQGGSSSTLRGTVFPRVLR